jgi:hypothetical protein
MSSYYEDVYSKGISIALLGSLFLFFAIYSLSDLPEEGHLPIFILACVMALLFILFFKLTIEIKPGVLSVGFGFIKSRIKLEEVTSCEGKRLRWFHGGGMHSDFKNISYITGPGPAVQLKTSKGKTYLFSTNKPDRLCEAIRTASSTR